MAKREKGEVFFPGFSLVYEKRAEEGKRSEKLYLLSKIYGDWASVFVGVRGKVYLHDENFM